MEKLSSVLKSQELKLALKAALLSAAAYFAIDEGVWLKAAFVVLALWLYFRPAVNLGRFWFSYGLNLAFLFFAPWDKANLMSRLLVVVGFGLVAGLILGAKNMVFIRRLASYQMAVFLLLGELVYFFFSVTSGAYALAVSSIGFILLMKEYYAAAGSRPMLFHAVVSALIYSQFLWAASVLPLVNSGKIALSLTLILLMNDIFAHRIGGNLSGKIIWRNALVAVISAAFIIGLSAGRLS